MSAQYNLKLAVVSSVSMPLSIAIASLIASPSYAYSPYQTSDQTNNRPQSQVNANQIAQIFRSTLSLPAGQTIATKINRQDTLYISKGETVNASLLVAQDITATNGTVLIPAGAVIEGQFVPAEGGSKFVAQKFTSRGATVRLQAESALINDVKDPRETNTGAILTDAGIGGAAGAVLGGVFRGGVHIEDVLGGAAAAVLIGNVTAPQVTVIEPSTVVNVITKQTITFAVRDDY
ncbi:MULTISPECIES: hypothetical protein [Pseudanabaena]|uniref:Uncharacterized protein n=2 Tax=Pseudanabaena TaxID=1152 RepID=L8N1L9_9CYAN|nr:MULTISPECIES: hypothetical protein [Pseudanabaena]ELS32969.1 hypothetical protein Pse7429DRAFT_2977 [Pseudanabaena biceps PCC 7429]MDG3494806.1 hypothetical protein [Pseudanabaena catenata USMAC16]